MRSDERRYPFLWLLAGRYSEASYGLRSDRNTSPVLEASQVHGRMPVWAIWEFPYRNKINGVLARATAKKSAAGLTKSLFINR
jgi:hypothetical protein